MGRDATASDRGESDDGDARDRSRRSIPDPAGESARDRRVPAAKGHDRAGPDAAAPGVDRRATRERKRLEREAGPATVRRMERRGDLDPDPSGFRAEARDLARRIDGDDDDGRSAGEDDDGAREDGPTVHRVPDESKRRLLTGDVGAEELEAATEDVEFGDVDYSEVAVEGLADLLPGLGEMITEFHDQKAAPQRLEGTLEKVDPPRNFARRTVRKGSAAADREDGGP